LIEILAISGSPVKESSTDILLEAVAASVVANLKGVAETRWSLIKLNELSFQPCQACGRAPESGFCLLDDDLTNVYEKLAACDLLLFGSPVYFDSVSAQAKAFIDRCNCYRPADFENRDPMHDFIKLIARRRPGAMVLVGGERGWFEGARRVIAGFFKWVEVVNEGSLEYRTDDFRVKGTAAKDPKALHDAHELGRHLADLLKAGLRE
jgi:multimeric flavodoxin WrbA